jgi:predicted transcriptional regulator
MASGGAGPVISVEMPADLAQRLEGLAIATNRPITEWVVQAVEDLIALRDWQAQAIQEGIDDVGRGDVVSHSGVVRLLNDWDADSD